MESKINEVKNQVYNLLENENSGHGYKHIKRVLDLANKFAKESVIKVDINLITLISLLHDVDDYKIFGIESEKNLTNAKRIMNKAKIDNKIQSIVLEEIQNIGYSKYLKGLRPKTIEGQIVSDADMCDALGAIGIIRNFKYCAKQNRPFFDEKVFPVDNLNSNDYILKGSQTGVCHIFEKILKLKDIMLTDMGKNEAIKRNKIVIDFLNELFNELNLCNWQEYLNKYL